MLSWVISAIWLDESIFGPLDLPEWLVPSQRLLLGTGRWMLWTLALLFPVAAWVLPDPRGALCSCCACILSLMCPLRWGPHCPPLPTQLCCLSCSGLVPRSFWSWGCWSKRPIPVACGSSPVLNCTAPFPALHVPSRPWPGFWVWFVSVWCSGAGSGSGELWGHGPGEAVVGLGNTLGKLPAMMKGIVWTRARER